MHNSGHFTIEACHSSQFEQHVRAVCGLPLGDCGMRVGAAVMVNVLGVGATPEEERQTRAICERALKIPGAAVHWYGKKGTARGRKVGHVTVTGTWAPSVLAAAASLVAPGGPPPAWAKAGSPLVGIIMGSDSDLPVMKAAADVLREFGVPFELTVVSAHRTPQRMFAYATSARGRGLRVIIAGAGGAAHLPGMVAAMTPLPVIGVPVPLKHLDGVDSLHSIVQMPRGVPVAAVAIGNATNAGLLAVRMLGMEAAPLGDAMAAYQARMEAEVMAKVAAMDEVGWETYAARAAASSGHK